MGSIGREHATRRRAAPKTNEDCWRGWRLAGSKDRKRVEIWRAPEGPFGARGRWRRVDLIEGGP